MGGTTFIKRRRPDSPRKPLDTDSVVSSTADASVTYDLEQARGLGSVLPGYSSDAGAAVPEKSGAAMVNPMYAGLPSMVPMTPSAPGAPAMPMAQYPGIYASPGVATTAPSAAGDASDAVVQEL